MVRKYLSSDLDRARYQLSESLRKYFITLLEGCHN